MKKNCLIILFVMFVNSAFCQTNNSYYYVPYTIENGDTIAQISINPVNIIAKRSFKNKWDERRYWKLVYNLKKVYPYAKLAKRKLSELEQQLLVLQSEKDKKKYTKKIEDEIRVQFEDDLKKLTITQGRLLIKLIDRETGATTYDLVKELRGNLSAAFWQALARVFGSSLKTEYDAVGSDKLIEEILIAIDSGYL